MDFQSNSTFRATHPIPICHYVMSRPLNFKLGNELHFVVLRGIKAIVPRTLCFYIKQHRVFTCVAYDGCCEYSW